MSTSLYMYPKIKQNGDPLDDQIKYCISRKYFCHDGSLGGHADLDESDLPYLEGVRDGIDGKSRKDVQKMIDAIEKYGSITISLEG